jgi:hypothetical protein
MARFLTSGRRRYGLPLILLTVAALFVLAAPAALADSGASDLPLQWTGSGTFVPAPSGGSLFTGTAFGTQIGKASIHADVPPQPFPIPACGSGSNFIVVPQTLTAANGDAISEIVSGDGCQSGPTTFHFTGTYTIVGGTGRYANATGSGSAIEDGDLGTSPFTFTESQNGTISLNP